MLNPGYKATASKGKPEVQAGAALRCPHCKALLMEAAAQKVLTRCKKCGRWVYAEKVENGKKN